MIDNAVVLEYLNAPSWPRDILGQQLYFGRMSRLREAAIAEIRFSYSQEEMEAVADLFALAAGIEPATSEFDG